MSEPIRRKLIEVALPLEAINRESAREKSIRHGHPSTLHLWWARRPLAAARAVLFAQLVDDPSARQDEFPTEEAQESERRRLFALIERLVAWENTTDEALLAEAHAEILKSTNGNPPPILDPFAGGGSIPLEAQRLGLEAHASDLNPVAVLINKALIEIPPRFAGQPPVFPGVVDDIAYNWPRATGLAEDVRRYGEAMRDEAAKRVGHMYPQAGLSDGSKANVIAWLWARTVTCPNPACGISMPLVRSFWLSKKTDRKTWAEPVIEGKNVRFEIREGATGPSVEGTVGRTGAVCVACNTPVPLTYIRTEGKRIGLGAILMAVVAEGARRRVYVPANALQIDAASVPRPSDMSESPLPVNPRDFKTPNYGIATYEELFTDRQCLILTTLSDLVVEIHSRVTRDAGLSGMGPVEASSYADAIALYLGLSIGRLTDYSSSICSWHSGRETIRNTFARQAIPMTWDFAEANPLSDSTGNFVGQTEWVASVIGRLPGGKQATVRAKPAQEVSSARPMAVATDPPYYDNIGYAELADFFYTWLRRSLGRIYLDETATMLTPKTEELVATPYRFGGKVKAEKHFEHGFVQTFKRIREIQVENIPITLFYAFKQAESGESGTASTGWETMLNGLIEAGLMVTATWPMRTEMGNRVLGNDSNMLASSIVLACRPRPTTAEATNRRGFIGALKAELPKALRHMQQGSVAPVDLAQAAIGPGMAVYTRYGRVVEADGGDMTVRTALALINQVLDEVLSEQEGDFDADTRFCVKWFSQYAWDEGDSGTADTLSRATNTSLAGMQRSGVFRAVAGKARLIAPEELPENWDPLADDRISVWEVAMHIAHTLNDKGVDPAATLMAAAAHRVDLGTVQELAYLLYNTCERRGWTKSAILFNSLGTSWSDLDAATRSRQTLGAATQSTFTFEDN